jgi:hypothetical protein
MMVQALKDKSQLRAHVLDSILSATRSQLNECERLVEDMVSILPSARTPQQRTSMNIILDDQKKVVRALKRLRSDVIEIMERD